MNMKAVNCQCKHVVVLGIVNHAAMHLRHVFLQCFHFFVCDQFLCTKVALVHELCNVMNFAKWSKVDNNF